MLESSDWNAGWMDRNRWIFDHLDRLNLQCDEALVVLVLNYLNDTGQPITQEIVMAKTGLESEQVENCFDSLSAKGYLSLVFENRAVSFRLDGLLDAGRSLNGKPVEQTLIREFGNEFGRPLSGSEMERILRLGNEYEEETILHALDEAAAYNKRSVSYIEALLAGWKKRGLDAADIESGKR